MKQQTTEKLSQRKLALLLTYTKQRVPNHEQNVTINLHQTSKKKKEKRVRLTWTFLKKKKKKKLACSCIVEVDMRFPYL